MITSIVLLAALLGPQDAARIPIEAESQALGLELVFEIYEVGDIMAQLAPEEPVGDFIPSEATTVRSVEAVKAFTESLKRHLDPPFTKGANEIVLSGLNIRKIPTSFIFTGTKQQQAWVEAFLRAHRGRDQFLMIDTRFMSGPRNAFRDPSGKQGNRFFETSAAVKEFVTSMKANGNVEFVSAPRVTTLAGQRASISATSQLSYVESWKIHVVEPGGQEIADPEIAIVEEGIRMEIHVIPVPKRATQNSSGEWVVEPGLKIALKLEIEQVDVERPIETKTIRLNSNSDDREVEISVPRITRLALDAQVELVVGAGILIGGPSTDIDHDVAIMISLPKTAERPNKTQRR